MYSLTVVIPRGGQKVWSFRPQTACAISQKNCHNSKFANKTQSPLCVMNRIPGKGTETDTQTITATSCSQNHWRFSVHPRIVPHMTRRFEKPNPLRTCQVCGGIMEVILTRPRTDGSLRRLRRCRLGHEIESFERVHRELPIATQEPRA